MSESPRAVLRKFWREWLYDLTVKTAVCNIKFDELPAKVIPLLDALDRKDEALRAMIEAWDEYDDESSPYDAVEAAMREARAALED